ncbi:MAG TPA: tRNA 2-thiouridine(34) synthase MnmA [Deltaproteobacteria bacterium]|nr:tRNA 2-thiouridine(34) synthase MnmA [Deltaproteobacteria bacterium]
MTNLDKNKVVVAMSGGVDSSVAALLMKQAGYEVVGMTLKLWDAPAGEARRAASCCSVEDITDARRVADQLGIPFYVVNSKTVFREQVVDRFVQEYLQGRTPNPCALCNDKVKFDFLLTKAFELGAHYVATGHYVKKTRDDATGEWQLKKGSDEHKDQSYFLFSLGQRQLDHTLFPVGEMSKEEVRNFAREAGLKTSEKPDSQEICFVADGDHGAFIAKYLQGKTPPPGEFVSESGEVLGNHEGIHRYTVGQRRGTGVAQGERVYVKSIDAATQRIVMSEDAELYQSALRATGVKWVRPVSDAVEVTAKIRYRHGGSAAILRLEKSGEAVRVEFREPQRAITPGQAVVFYRGDEVLGGGWIERGIPD